MRGPSIRNGEPNGSAAPVNGAGRKRSGPRPAAAKDSGGAAAPAAGLAPFAAVKTASMDTPMWPIYPVVWLQPELRPEIPASGLRSERRHKIPAPDCMPPEVAPAGHAPRLDTAREPLAPEMARALPGSGLAPLGWDPRAESRGHGKEGE